MEAGKLKFENNRASLSYQHLEVAKPYFHNFTNKHVQKIFKRGQNIVSMVHDWLQLFEGT